MGIISLIARKLNLEKHPPQARAPPYESKISSKSPVRLVQPKSSSDGAYSFDSTHEDVAPAPVVSGCRDDDGSGRLSTRLSVRDPGFTNLIRNRSPGKAYVDLLDAQSEFRPLDFQGRVKASGVRDYGEDVADRNITANKSMSSSQQEPADYAQRRPFPSWSRRVPVLKEDENENEDEGELSSSTSTADGTAELKKKKKALRRQTMQFAPPSPIEELYSTLTLAEPHTLVGKKKNRNRRHSLQSSVEHSEVWWPETSTSLHWHRSLSTSSKTKTTTNLRSMFEDGNRALKYAVNNQPILSPKPTFFHRSASLATSAHMHGDLSAKLPQQPATASSDFFSGIPDLSSLPSHLKEQATAFKHKWHGDTTDRDAAPSPCIRKTKRSCSQSGDSVQLHDDSRAGTNSSTRHWSLSSSTPTISSSSSAMYGRLQSRNTTCTSLDLSTKGLLNPSLLSIDHEIAMGQLPLNMPYTTADSIKDSSFVLSKEILDIDDYASDDDDGDDDGGGGGGDFSSSSSSFISVQLGRDVNEEDLLFDGGYGLNGLQLPGLKDAFAASAPAPSISLRRSHRSKSVSRPLTSEVETCLNFDDIASISDIVLSRPLLDDDDDDDDDVEEDETLAPFIDIRRHRRSPGQSPGSTSFEQLDQIQNPQDWQDLTGPHTPMRAYSPAGSASSRRSETKRLAAFNGPESSPSSSSTSGSVVGRNSNSLRFHPHASHYHLHGSNVGEQVIEEEQFDDKVDTATAVRLRKETRAHKRASVMSISRPVLGHGIVRTISIEGRQRSSSTGQTTRSIPNIVDVPELTDDFGGLADSE